MEIKLYNSLTKKVETFAPRDGHLVKMYNCGPTVYARAHLGNLRAYIVADLWRRLFEINNWQVLQVINITDVGHLASDADEGADKVERAAKAAGLNAFEISQRFTDLFLSDIHALNIKPPHHLPRATAHIAEQIEMIQILEVKGFTYTIEDGIYFDTSKFENYGNLQNQQVGQKLAGARVEINPKKRHPADFALWKFSPPQQTRQMEWPSPWGAGFPGWHIECSAMARKYLGQPFDLHTGGVDHIPVHHTNEIAQSEAAFAAPLAHYWAHSEFLNFNDTKMSKSQGQVITLSDLIKAGIHPLAFRLFILSGHYQSHQKFTWAALKEAQGHLFAYNALVANVQGATTALAGESGAASRLESLNSAFLIALADNLNTPKGLTYFYEFMTLVNKLLSQNRLDEPTKATALHFIDILNKLLALYDPALVSPIIPEKIKVLIDQRDQARKNQDFQLADNLRIQIIAAGYAIEDGPNETRVFALNVNHG